MIGAPHSAWDDCGLVTIASLQGPRRRVAYVWNDRVLLQLVGSSDIMISFSLPYVAFLPSVANEMYNASAGTQPSASWPCGSVRPPT